MEKIKLVIPTMNHREELQLYKEDFAENKEVMHGGSRLSQFEKIEEWLTFQQLFQSPETVPEGYVPGITFLAMNEAETAMIGIINLRYVLNEYLMQYGGHIDYSIKKNARKKGYASEMLAQALQYAANEGMEKLLLTCDLGNIASAKVIEKNGGVLENIIKDPEDQVLVKRYWITL